MLFFNHDISLEEWYFFVNIFAIYSSSGFIERKIGVKIFDVKK